jgi:hypothetical protein
MIKFGFHIINQQQLYASSELYSCCRFTRALALYTQLAPLPAASLLYTLHSSFTRPQGFTYAKNSAFSREQMIS